ncbi:branched-chain amino acid transport system ATP-binding protein [Enhydrobacter aerosaccus]|uniref:Branched-chain amino acid transport system ATP-binding protein n=1 Tax=Enhydrobacter aerosaccus TaxID=225324 RepID=A0A1T4JVB8_9HYPH|nr:ATP-binding cassette domain-containing protein [Enhydrobacter aerosaccus]SJZ34172.1 branched-chain amino acid transport system ATP-binding protein [Enhydrobacter aerosaccus]
MTVLLEVVGLSGGYEPVQIFKDVDFAVEDGACAGLFGPNGHGKTTLLRTISGLIDPWSGSIVFDGIQLNTPGERRTRKSRNLNYDLLVRRRMDPKKVARAGLIHVAQGSPLFPELTVAETLSIAPAPARAGGRAVDPDLPFSLFPQLKERRHSKTRFLSGGERQMLAIACGMLAAPRLLILDEPTLGLSPKLRLELASAIHAIRQAGIPIILVDQDVGFLRDLVDTLHVFDHGSISRVLSKAEIPDHETLMADLFGGVH